MGYSEYITGRKVAFVGACPNIIGRGMGVSIDSHDIVAKSGHSWSFKENSYSRDYGKKCDVVYVNRQYYREMKPMPVKDMKQRGVKWLCLKGSSPEDMREFDKYLRSRVIREVFPHVNSILKSASMGNYIVQDILNQKPESLYITGIDFFASKNPKFVHNDYHEYLDGYLPNKIREQGNIINVNKLEDGHNFKENAKFFYDLFNRYDNLKTDKFIYDLLVDIVHGKVKQGDIKWNVMN